MISVLCKYRNCHIRNSSSLHPSHGNSKKTFSKTRICPSIARIFAQKKPDNEDKDNKKTLTTKTMPTKTVSTKTTTTKITIKKTMTTKTTTTTKIKIKKTTT